MNVWLGGPSNDAASVEYVRSVASRLPRTRLQVPAGGDGLIPRPRLLNTLDAGSGVPLTVITGLPGAGKTTLVAQWLQASESHPIWVTCDRPDTDPKVLWAAITAAVSLSGVEATEHTHEPPHMDEVLDAATLINHIDRSDRPVTLVIDDAHLPGTAVGVLQPLIDWLPTHCRLILISRRPPSLPLAELQVRGQLLEISDDDLRLTAFETARLLESLGLDEQPRVIDEVHRQTEGWVASVTLTAQALRSANGADVSTDVLLATVPAPLARFLRDELHDPSVSRLREFLLDVCVLEELTVEACAALVGPEEVPQLLDELSRSGLPAEYLPMIDGYRLHRQFRAVLRELAAARGPEFLRDQHTKAAAAFEASGDQPRAIEHYTWAGEHEAAVSLVASCVLRGINDRAVAAVSAWLKGADLGLVRTDPSGQAQVLAATGSLVEGQLALTRRWLDRTDALQAQLSDGVRSQAAICRAALHLLEGDLDGVEEQFAAAERSHRDWPIVWRAFHFLLVARARLWSGHLDRAQAALEAIEHDPDLDEFIEVAVAAVRAEFAVTVGEPAEALRRAEEAVAAIGHADDPAHQALQDVYRARGLAYYEQGFLDAAEKDLGVALTAADPTRPAMASVALLGLARVAAARNRIDDAQDLLVQARDRLVTRSPLHEMITASEVRLDLRIGDLERARHVVDRMNLGAVRCRLEIDLALSEGDVDKAAEIFDRLPPVSTARSRLEHAILTARLDLAAGQRRRARAAINEALEVAEPRYLVRPFFEDGNQLGDLLVAELDRRPRSLPAMALVREHDRMTRLAAETPILDGNTSAPLGTLTPREREVLTLLAGDRPARQLAEQLHISVNTFRTHVKSIYAKLGVSSRAEVTRVLR